MVLAIALLGLGWNQSAVDVLSFVHNSRVYPSIQVGIIPGIGIRQHSANTPTPDRLRLLASLPLLQQPIRGKGENLLLDRMGSNAREELDHRLPAAAGVVQVLPAPHFSVFTSASGPWLISSTRDDGSLLL